MWTASPSERGNPRRSRWVLASAATAASMVAACVDTTPPWEKVTAQGGAVGMGGQPIDSGTGAGGALEGGAGDQIDLSASAWDGSGGGVGGGFDAPASGAGGTIDAGVGGAGGSGLGGAFVDVSVVGTGGAAGGIDGSSDAPLGGGGGSGTGGTTRTGGTTGSGGVVGSGGTTEGTKTGGKGGPPKTGGAPGSGGTTSPDAAPDLGVDLGPDAGPDLGPDTPDANPLLVGLVAYYKCDETGGGTLSDSSGHAYHGTLNGSASFGSGKVGNGLVLTASGSSYASLPPTVFSGLGDFTIATWVNVTSATYKDWMRIFDAGINANQETAPATGTQYMNLTPRNSAGNLRWSISKDGMRNEESLNTSSLPADTWKHVTVVLTGGLGTLYVDGVDVKSAGPETAMKPSDIAGMDYAYLGKSQFSVDAYFDGLLDEFRVYNRALSAAEVLALYQFTGP